MKKENVRFFRNAGIGWFIGGLIGMMIGKVTTFAIIWTCIPVVVFMVLMIFKKEK